MRQPGEWMAVLGGAVVPATLLALNGQHTIGSWTAVVLNAVLGVAAALAGILAVVKARRWVHRLGIAAGCLFFAAFDFLAFFFALSVASGSYVG
jgi:hypothetical protein